MKTHTVCYTAKKMLAFVALLLLNILSPHASAGNIPEDQGACGTLTTMGQHTYIYNNSQYSWNVVFKTYRINEMFVAHVNAGAVKYLNDGWWVDSGVGLFGGNKIYTVPVGPGESVPIAYCADRSGDSVRINGVVIIHNLTGADNAHGSPAGSVEFTGTNSTPIFNNIGPTPYVAYNKNLNGVFENGSLTICPNDSTCRIP